MTRRGTARSERVRLLAVVFALGLLASACASAGEAGVSDGGSGGSVGLTFGQAGDPADVSRTIEVSGTDAMRFAPDAIDIEVGETVTFDVTNEGRLPHEFTLGDEAMQDEHEKEMAEAGTMLHDHPYSVWLEPGETKQLTWAFTKAGEFLFGCHVPGHYAAGMVGTITVR